MKRLLFAAASLFCGLLAGCGGGNPPVAPVTPVTLSGTSFDFGENLVGHAIVSTVVTVTNPGMAQVTLAPSLSGDASFALAPQQGSCAGTLAAGANCTVAVQYLPTTASGATPQATTLHLGGNAAGTAQDVSVQGESATLAAGTVSPTNNPQVALYTITLPFPGAVTVAFGTTTSYGRATWSQSTASAGPVSVYVAGMLGSTTYHMQATVQLSNGASMNDVDHTFATGPAPTAGSSLTATTTAGATPQSGVEQLSVINGPAVGLMVTDLNANVLWSYLVTQLPSTAVEGAKLLANGDFLITLGQGSNYPLTSPTVPQGAVQSIREIDLAGNTVREITIAQLNAKLAAAGYALTLQQFHHDVSQLPNGHWIVLASMFKSYPNVTGYGAANVLGDVIVDLDTTLNPAWVWSEFDHLDVNRHPFNFPDWTHTNAVLYSPDDGSLIVSMRHQNWVIKVDYKNGTGAGDILWHLGEGGDFTLVDGTDPTDWNYAQHFPAYFSPNTSGVFSLGMMDNGDDRIFPKGVTCQATGTPLCLYTTIPVFRLDEGAKTATLQFHQILPGNLYSYFGGNTEQLANGNTEYDLAGTVVPGSAMSSDIYEVTPGSSLTAPPQTVWHMALRNANAYRGYRIGSLYPGVQW